MATLPNYVQFLAADYNESLDYRVRRSEMENGLSKQRPSRTKPLRVRKGFQHTAARRRLKYSPADFKNRLQVSTHSRAKAAEEIKAQYADLVAFQHTAARRRLI